MQVTFYSTKSYDRGSFRDIKASRAEFANHHFHFLEIPLDQATAELARGSEAVCVFVHDHLDRKVLEILKENGTRIVALRCAGFNNVDLDAAQQLEITIARVPAYSPHAVAEHAVALILGLNRHLHRAHARVREGNFSLRGLMGFDLNGKTVGVVGTGKIGAVFTRIMHGFGCRLLGHDPFPSAECEALGMRYVDLPELLQESKIVSLHCPLTKDTQHLIDHDALEKMQDGAMLINTGRGALVHTQAVIDALKSRKLGALGLDVYEEEDELFFQDLSEEIIQDDLFMRLLTFPNVMVTAHQGFFTAEALHNIAETTLRNLTAFETGEGELHQVPLPL